MAADYKPSKAFSTRLKSAEQWRTKAEPSIKEIYSFIAPGREKEFDRKPDTMYDDEPETFTSLPEDLASDFAADLVTYYTPSEMQWTEYQVNTPVPQSAQKAVKELVSEREGTLFDMITASNYNDIAPQIMFEANHGTAAMWVDQAHLAQPIHVECVPPSELLITPGHLGILDRFREKWAISTSIEALFNGWDVDLSHPTLSRKLKKEGEFCKVVWGFWVDWTDPGNPQWKCEITVDDCRITQKELVLGPLAGSCPLLVGRFNPQPNRPWGRGPAWKALPDMRVHNAIDEAILNGLDQSLLNTIIYADDGFLDAAEGLEPGRAYPASRSFTRDQVYELNRGVNLDVGYYSEEHREDRLRACFYQDGPRQRGDTPPTASQWIDERRRVQVRLGKPSAPLWTEFFLPFIQRVEQIGVENGTLDGQITHNERVLTVLPVSPLQRAQNQDKVMTSKSNLDTAFSVFGDALPNFVDIPATLQNHIDASGDELTVVQKGENGPAETPQ